MTVGRDISTISQCDANPMKNECSKSTVDERYDTVGGKTCSHSKRIDVCRDYMIWVEVERSNQADTMHDPTTATFVIYFRWSYFFRDVLSVPPRMNERAE